jgi:DsbC/DsbD-like thiol-disulfide interchange protein
MTRLWLTVAVTAMAATASAQSFFKNQPPRLALEVRVDGTLSSAARTAHVTISATPIPGVHVYAPGNPDYVPVSVSVTPVEGLDVGTPGFPAGEHYFFAPLKQAVKVYSRPFVVRIPVKASAAFLKRRDNGVAVPLKGVVSYQACDDKVCFPPQTLPFTADVPLRARPTSK